MKLLQSIFGGGEARGRYPESLVRAAIQRAVEGTDARLRLVSGFDRRLRQPVIHAIDHIVALVDAISTPLMANRREHGADPRLAALFASAPAMLELFGRDAALTAFLSTSEGVGSKRVTALLLAERRERNILGMDLVGDKVRRDVQQVTVGFGGHRLLDPGENEEEMRRQLKRRGFDHLIALALRRITEMRVEREDLLRQRDLLRSKCKALDEGGWCFDAPTERCTDPGALESELDAISVQLDGLGADTGILNAYLETLTETLGGAEHQLWAEDIVLFLDAMNVQRDETDPSARRIVFQELHNARGQRAVMLPISLEPRGLPQREDFVTAAQRYL